MIAVGEEIIRRKVRDGMSQRAVAKELGHSRKTVAKAISMPIILNRDTSLI